MRPQQTDLNAKSNNRSALDARQALLGSLNIGGCAHQPMLYLLLMTAAASIGAETVCTFSNGTAVHRASGSPTPADAVVAAVAQPSAHWASPLILLCYF